jgi:hypothetical protein
MKVYREEVMKFCAFLTLVLDIVDWAPYTLTALALEKESHVHIR